jgi:hypothetical protein
MTKSLLALLILSAVPTSALAYDGDFSLMWNGFGFDFGNTQKARCESSPLTPGSNCGIEQEDRSPSGHSGRFLSCDGESSVYLVFASRGICEQELALMRANAP